MCVKIIEFFTETGKIILVVVQEPRLLRLEQARFHEVLNTGIEHEGVGFDTEIATTAQEIYHPVSPTKCSTTDVQQFVPGVESVPDQRFELCPARLLEPLDATANLGSNFIQAFATFLQGFCRIDEAHLQNAPYLGSELECTIGGTGIGALLFNQRAVQFDFVPTQPWVAETEKDAAFQQALSLPGAESHPALPEIQPAEI